MPLRIIYFDFNSYFASVEQQVRPELRGRPIGVVAVMTDTTVCIAASYEAKAHGVKTGTLVADAKRMCPALVLVESRPMLYVEFHHRLLGVVESCVPIERVNSIDEMFCQLTGSQQQRANAESLARKTKQAIYREVGEHVRCSVGIAPNEFLAKTASDMHKPDGLVVIEERDLPHVLHRLALRDFCGIGPRMEARLHQHGIHTVEQLCAADMHALRRAWGGIEGERLFAKLRGEDVVRPPTRRASISHSHVLAPESRHPEAAFGVLDRLTQKAAMRLRHESLLAGSMSLSVDFRDGRNWQVSRAFDATDETLTLLGVLRELWAAREKSPWPARAHLLRVGVTLADLVDKRLASRALFSNRPNLERLDAAIDRLNLRYGKNAVYFGGAHEARSAASMRIAFNHIPDPRLEGDKESEKS